MISLAARYIANPQESNANPSAWRLIVPRLQAAARHFYGSRLWHRSSRLYRKVELLFTLHPRETRETYLQHLWFTVKMSVRFAFVGLCLLTHGVLPFLFTRTASSQIEKLYLIMRGRIPHARRQAIESEYEI